jgi:peptide chain release factor 2
VKDLRTGKESTSPQDVLNGDLTPFMEASLAQRIAGGAKAEIADLQ